eukprot:COSAG06_NODE_4122_length_4548_cov_102.653405_7_plen_191_part_00
MKFSSAGSISSTTNTSCASASERRHDLRLVSGAVAGARMDARGGRMRGWRSGVGGREVRAVAPHEGVGGRTERQPRAESERTSPAAAAALISRRGCRAPAGSSPGKRQDAARTRAAKGQDHAAAIVDVRARERPQHQPSHGASASAARDTETDGGGFRRHARRQQGGRERAPLPCLRNLLLTHTCMRRSR